MINEPPAPKSHNRPYSLLGGAHDEGILGHSNADLRFERIGISKVYVDCELLMSSSVQSCSAWEKCEPIQ
jgi:hypothetical protein